MRITVPFFLGLIVLLRVAAPPGLRAQEDGCRLKTADLRPIIQRFNPFFANHRWDSTAQIEMAQMSEDRLLAITQEGCKRHHIKFNLVVSPEACRNNYDFWVGEVSKLLQKVYWERKEYEVFGPEFQRIFDEKLHYYGFNHQFNFPVGTRNFICAIYYQPDRGARVSIEMVSFIFRENVRYRTRRIAPEEDDGWLGIKDPEE